MGELVDELVDDAIDADRPAHEFKRCVSRVVEDEVVAIEFGQFASSNTARQLSTSLAAI